MSIRHARIAATVLLLLSVLAGCAKKQTAVIPPPTPPAPDTSSAPAPAPAPTPAPPEPTMTTQLGNADLQPAFFDLDSYTLRDDARATLDKDAKLLRDHPKVTVTIEGHCDERGTSEYNQALGERRAQAARDYLVAAGINTGRIEIISYGKERPFAPGHDESAWQQNRRAHLVVRSSS
jgi:peptidoglycan-associated lipoprotein